MSTYNGGSAVVWPVEGWKPLTDDSPVVWDTATGIEERRDTGFCGTIPYNLLIAHGETMPEIARLKFGTHKDFIEWQEGGAK